jgi:cleavage and polyadenylation specificity factor subunit 3
MAHKAAFQVMGTVDVKQTGEHELTLEWDSSASNDMIADSTLALITGIDKSPASVKRNLIFSCRYSP